VGRKFVASKTGGEGYPGSKHRVRVKECVFCERIICEVGEVLSSRLSNVYCDDMQALPLPHSATRQIAGFLDRVAAKDDRISYSQEDF